MSSERTPVVFIHGLWIHGSSWAPWMETFEGAGYDPIAPGWPGDAPSVEETRANPDAQAGKSFDDIVAHYQAIIEGLPARPILVGHSFGGTVAEKLLGMGLAAAAVAIDAAQIKGVLPVPIAALRSAFPGLKNPANLNRAVSLSADEFRYGFGNALTPEESDDLYGRWAIPGPAKPLFEASVMNFLPRSPLKVDTKNEERGPLLLIMGGQDHTVPEAITKATLKQYRHSSATTDIEEFADRGHSLTIDHGWPEVAGLSLKWLKEQGL
ncbi:alpha/beta hydrolase [Streptomyces bauhiniae]|uniref:Alpha/beta hydrolase n=1 Tax=Streptomyces bauhiniae TaxID=2340725 RepID=A0A7K3QRF5_9ACTN|nr:alpha/beta hydrolase [Streptomyces bauhiniae]NEB92488.1 alpha/beta hydrolase [Streptomyces bauhiniae]